MNRKLVPFSADSPISDRLPMLFQGVPDGGRRFWEFFTVNIRNSNTRRAYHKAVPSFAARVLRIRDKRSAACPRRYSSRCRQRSASGCDGYC